MSEGQWGSAPPSMPLPLPPLPVQAGLPERSPVFEAQGSRAGTPQFGGISRPSREWGERGKASLPALAEEEEGAQLCHQREQEQGKKMRERMMVARGALASTSRPFGYGMGLLPSPLPGSPALSCPWPGTGLPPALKLGRVVGWAGIFPVECLRIRRFHAA